jgi:uncharacterized membrane protein YbhN (UPF0104 family)
MKWVKCILATGIVGFLCWYLAQHWGESKVLIKFRSMELIALFLLCFLIAGLNARVVQSMLKVLGLRTQFWEMTWLEHAAQLLNYAPMKFGTLFRAHYLKRHFGLEYASYAVCFAYMMFLMIGSACGLGLASLWLGIGFETYKSKILGLILGVLTASSLAMLVMPIKEPIGKSRFSIWLRAFLSGRIRIRKSRNNLVLSTIIMILNFFFGALRIGIIYKSLNVDLSFSEYLVLGSLGYVTLFASITPGALGIREVILSFGAIVLGIPIEVGVLVAMIDRVIAMVYIFSAGTICVLYLWHKSPADFNESKVASAKLEPQLRKMT